jgi:hypothetical protein
VSGSSRQYSPIHATVINTTIIAKIGVNTDRSSSHPASSEPRIDAKNEAAFARPIRSARVHCRELTDQRERHQPGTRYRDTLYGPDSNKRHRGVDQRKQRVHPHAEPYHHEQDSPLVESVAGPGQRHHRDGLCECKPGRVETDYQSGADSQPQDCRFLGL